MELVELKALRDKMQMSNEAESWLECLRREQEARIPTQSTTMGSALAYIEVNGGEIRNARIYSENKWTKVLYDTDDQPVAQVTA